MVDMDGSFVVDIEGSLVVDIEGNLVIGGSSFVVTMDDNVVVLMGGKRAMGVSVCARACMSVRVIARGRLLVCWDVAGPRVPGTA